MNQGENICIKKLNQKALVPYDLLLIADPSREMVDEYVKQSEVFVALNAEEIIGVVVLYPLSPEIIEVKNIAVAPQVQGQGIGSALIEYAIQHAVLSNKKKVCIGTADSSTRQLQLYQKLGFSITGVKQNFFIENYPEPIFENGIQARHLIVLTRHL